MKPATVFLGEMTNPEVEAFLKSHHTVIVPTGATEQHGPHGPLLTDVLIPQEIARRAAPALGAVVAPPINYALSYPHTGFTGLVQIRIPTFMSLIEDLCVSFATSGFKRIIFLNGHYDNTYAIAYACANAADKMSKEVKAFPVNYWDALTPDEVAEFDAEDRPARQPAETSAVLRSTRILVDMEKANAEFCPSPTTRARRPARCTRRSSSPPRLVLLATKSGTGRRARLHAGDRRALSSSWRPPTLLVLENIENTSGRCRRAECACPLCAHLPCRPGGCRRAQRRRSLRPRFSRALTSSGGRIGPRQGPPAGAGADPGGLHASEDGRRGRSSPSPPSISLNERRHRRASWVRDVPPDVTTNTMRPEGRLVVIMFDWSIRFADQVLAKRVATAAVDALGPDDLAAVVFSSGFGNAGTPQNFTSDRARLLASINRPWAVALYNPPVGPLHDPRNSNEVMLDDPEGYLSGDCLCRVCVLETIARHRGCRARRPKPAKNTTLHRHLFPGRGEPAGPGVTAGWRARISPEPGHRARSSRRLLGAGGRRAGEDGAGHRAGQPHHSDVRPGGARNPNQ
jgi:creatinine amidohydrolase